MSMETFLNDVFGFIAPPKNDDPFESEEYQKFVEAMAKECRCRESMRPCDGVMAGGICDGFTDDDESEHVSWDEDEE